MSPVSLVAEAHKFIAEVLKPGDIAIDATCGNGYDTLFLAQSVGSIGKVYGFDIQQQALAATALKLEEQQQYTQVELVLAGHEDIEQYIPEQYHQGVTAIMFNLGYLPGGDKTIITQEKTTLLALNAAARLLKKSGLMTIIAYPGHEGGLQELQTVQDWANQLDPKIFHYSLLAIDQLDLSKPQLFIIQLNAQGG